MREQLIDRMIRIYGFEHEIILEFARMCEEWPKEEIYDRILAMLVESHEEFPEVEDEEDDE